MLSELVTDRRTVERIPAPELIVRIKIPGKWFGCSAHVLDFNRYGLSLLCAKPLPAKGHLFLSLEYPGLSIKGVVATLHNCRPHHVSVGAASRAITDLDSKCGADNHLKKDIESGKFRCGIQFRTRSCHQFDCHKIDRGLIELERRLRSSES